MEPANYNERPGPPKLQSPESWLTVKQGMWNTLVKTIKGTLNRHSVTPSQFNFRDPALDGSII